MQPSMYYGFSLQVQKQQSLLEDMKDSDPISKSYT